MQNDFLNSWLASEVTVQLKCNLTKILTLPSQVSFCLSVLLKGLNCPRVPRLLLSCCTNGCTASLRDLNGPEIQTDRIIQKFKGK